ncbi:MAG TPA: hypothetical protein VK619_04095 [Pyrinomonadaceae bacterium]|nr:hypothetical protein [Pyrinomonadaceae bacterium]
MSEKLLELKSSSLTCAACGSVAHRERAQFCSTCGRSLDEDYRPADALRASYHQQHRLPAARFEHANVSGSAQFVNRPSRNKTMRPIFQRQNRNGASTTALAFVTYSLVPYLGILFCPGAVLVGSWGFVQSVRATDLGGRRAAYTSIILGVVILGAQLFLWWILYKIPQWGRGF